MDMDLITMEYELRVDALINEFNNRMYVSDMVLTEKGIAPVVHDKNSAQNDDKNKKGFIENIIDAIRNFFHRIGEFITGKKNNPEVSKKIADIEEAIKDDPSLRGKLIEVPFFSTKSLENEIKKYFDDIKNGKSIDTDFIKTIFFDESKTTKTTVGEVFDWVKKNLSSYNTDMDHALSFISDNLKEDDDNRKAGIVANIANGWARAKGGVIKMIKPLSIAVGAGFITYRVAKKADKEGIKGALTQAKNEVKNTAGVIMNGNSVASIITGKNKPRKEKKKKHFFSFGKHDKKK